jgi:putative iron-regulated protein
MDMKMVVLAWALSACGGEDPVVLGDAQPVIENYATIVHASYDESLTTANALKVAVDAFVAAPSASTLEAARDAWLAAREPYGQTESYRFYDGPIDNAATGPEGQINAWPLDEVYIDYVEGQPASGIINDPTMFPTLSIEVIAGQNEQGGEKNISTGYHAIEFLLWGQDLSATGPGDRPHTDYVMGAMGTAMNQDRRGRYLALAAELLVQDLTAVRDAWAPGQANYAASFTAEAPAEAVRRMLQGMGSLSGAELSGERMTTALDNRDQEDEHSCFSDNTHRDLHLNALAVENVYLGRFGTIDGPGIDELVAARDPALDTRMKAELTAALDAIAAIPPPFDQALVTDSSRALIMTAINALRDATDTIVEVATLLGIPLNLE